MNLIGLTIEDFQTIVGDALHRTLLESQGFQSQQSSETYLTREETANLLRLSLPTLSRYTTLGILNGYQIGTRILYKKSEIESSLKEVHSSKYRRV